MRAELNFPAVEQESHSKSRTRPALWLHSISGQYVDVQKRVNWTGESLLPSSKQKRRDACSIAAECSPIETRQSDQTL